MTKNVSMTREEKELIDKSEMADFKSQIGMGMSIFFFFFVCCLIASSFIFTIYCIFNGVRLSFGLVRGAKSFSQPLRGMLSLFLSFIPILLLTGPLFINKGVRFRFIVSDWNIGC